MFLKIPLTEVRLDASGFVVKEALLQDFQIDHALMPVHTVDQWELIYDHLLDFDVLGGDLTGFFSYGGSASNPHDRPVRQEDYFMAMDGDFLVGGDFKMEMDASQKTLSLEVDGEKITIDADIGDFQYSPIVILYQADDSPGLELTLL